MNKYFRENMSNKEGSGRLVTDTIDSHAQIQITAHTIFQQLYVKAILENGNKIFMPFSRVDYIIWDDENEEVD